MLKSVVFWDTALKWRDNCQDFPFKQGDKDYNFILYSSKKDKKDVCERSVAITCVVCVKVG